MTSCRVRTNAWYGDEELVLDFPDDWEVTVHRPSTPPPLTSEQIEDAFDRPVGQEPLRRLGVGSSTVAVVVDDLTRPTPASEVLPALLGHLDDAGIPAGGISIVVGTGTHGPPRPDAIRRKAGDHVAERYRVLVHDDSRDLVWLGRTTRGTPVVANRLVASADLVVGVGGVYPQHSVGFGGGVKSALGVLGRRTIRALHYGHESVEGAYDIDNPFRRDLSEIAAMLGMRTGVAIHVDADRRPVRVVSGEPRRFYRDAVSFSVERYTAPSPGDADVVVSNAYPMDTSLTFMRSKGIIPLLDAHRGASRIVLAACPEGNGHHGLFPFVDLPRFHRERDLARVIAAHPARSARKVGRRIRGKLGVPAVHALPDVGDASEALAGRTPEAPPERPAEPHNSNEIWLVRPGRAGTPLASPIPGMATSESWAAAIDSVRREQAGRGGLRVVVYAAAPLQVLEPRSASKVAGGPS